MCIMALTLWMNSLNVVIVELKRCIAADSLEPNNVVDIVVDFSSDLTQRQIVRANVVHHENISFHLNPYTKMLVNDQ